MEGVITLGQAPSEFSVPKSAQANHAFQFVLLLPLFFILIPCFCVNENRDGGNGGGVEPFGEGIGSGGVLQIEGVEVVEAGRPENVGDGDGGAAGPGLGMGLGEEPFGVEVEEEDEENDEEERDDGGEHDVAVVGENGVKHVSERGEVGV